MRSQLVQLGAWTAATGAAVVLSWLGVHAVLADTVFEQPTAVPLPASAPAPAASESAGSRPTDGPTTGPAAAGTAPPSASQSQAPGQSPGGAPGSPSAAASPSRTPTRQPSPSSSVRSYLVPGGRVALDIREDHAELVSATPETGWQMQVWNGDHWMRIDFSHPEGTSSVFVTWNGHPPTVQTVPAAG
ncbi:hypothetical protein [Kitasatospora sp. NPDC088346]|uniref:hypothetical protein n=1 Tax=Kitasatospora sp. NPDC088346 TaxID=3364073 RepID=UPI0038140DD5